MADADLNGPPETAAHASRQNRQTLAHLAFLGIVASAAVTFFIDDDAFRETVPPQHWEALALAALSATSLAFGVGDLDLRRHIRRTTALLSTALFTVLLAFLASHTQWSYVAHTLFIAGLGLWLTACSLPYLLQRFTAPKVAVIGPEVETKWLQRCLPNAEHILQPRNTTYPYDVVVVSPYALADPRWSCIISDMAVSGCEVRPLAAYIEENAGRIPCGMGRNFCLPQRGQTTQIYLRFKRALDLLAVVVFGIPAVIAILLASGAILLTMGRPIFYTQERVGLHGRIFRMHKLRTMCIQSTTGPQIATSKNDKRITPVGAFLRRLHIDELPQICNIFDGEMTLIGPRPEQPSLVNQYVREIPNFALRHNVKPGILGWAQLRYGYASTVEESREKLEYDLFYVRRMSPMLDLKILCQTIPLMLNKNHVR